MSLTKEIIEQEALFESEEDRRVMHLHREGVIERTIDGLQLKKGAKSF